MTDGRAVVAIDAALGDTIDMRQAYYVFVTPEGDCKGLYVSQKTAAGFVVRELQGGRSTLAFEYGIVVRPLHADEARLAIEPAQPPHHVSLLGSPETTATHGRVVTFLTPEARLKARIGTQAYVLERRSRSATR